jgi:hypothetical protein
MGLAFHRAGETEVGAMAGIGIFATRAARLAALNGAFGQRSTAHGFRFRQFSSEFAKACGGSWIVHAFILRLYMPKDKAKNQLLAEIPFWRRTPRMHLGIASCIIFGYD